jgi:putative ABC transport system permease protein
MTAITYALSNVRHRPGRVLLTALGITVGIATIVGLLAISAGATQTAGKFIHLGRSDMGLFQKNAADPTTSVLPESLISDLRSQPWVTDAMGLELLVEDIPSSPSSLVFGAQPNSFETQRMVFLQGHMYTGGDQIVIGDQLAPQLHASVGRTVVVAHRRMTVAGIYHLGVTEQDAGAFVPLSTAEAIAGHPHEVTSIVVKLAPGVRPNQAKRTVEKRFPGLLVITDPDEALRAGANGQLISHMTLVIVVLALVIGGISVMNTMLLSVVERRAEFAVLSAVGFSGPDVAKLVLIEEVLVSLLGAAAGLVVGVAGAGLLVRAVGAQHFVSPDFTAWVLGRALLIGVLIGVGGGLYPAWRAAHVSPSRTLAQQ